MNPSTTATYINQSNLQDFLDGTSLRFFPRRTQRHVTEDMDICTPLLCGNVLPIVFTSVGLVTFEIIINLKF